MQRSVQCSKTQLLEEPAILPSLVPAAATYNNLIIYAQIFSNSIQCLICLVV